jgi:hypothetical protein
MEDFKYILNPQDLVGKQILAFVRFIDHEGNAIKEVEIFGQVNSVGEHTVKVSGDVWTREGDDISHDNEKDYSLPFSEENYWHAAKGEYELIISKKRIPHPDILTRWVVTPPKN